MNKIKVTAIIVSATVVVTGGLIFTQVDKWFQDEPTGPGSGDVVGADEAYTDGKDRGNGVNQPGPGSGDVVTSDEGYTDGKDRGNGINEPGPGSGDVLPSDEPTGPGSGDVLPAVVGSCNSIDDASICIDYIGSYWATPQVANLNCDGVGIYSSQRCPQPSVGGCNTNAGTVTEMITWFYGYGGAPIVPDNINNAAGVCNANPFGTWIPG